MQLRPKHGGMKLKLAIKLIIMLLVLFLVGCQTKNSISQEVNENPGSEVLKSEKEIPEEIPTVRISLGGNEIKTENILECWTENCNQGLLISQDKDLKKFTKGVEPTSMKEGESISIEVDGVKPSKMSYMIQRQEGQTTKVVQKSIEGSRFPIHGEGKKRVLVSLEWNNGDELVGFASKAFVLEVSK